MKNYLFAPFKDDKEKISAFKLLKDSLQYDNNQISDGDLILFIGRLESYYDVIINDIMNRYNELDDKYEELQADKKLVHAHDVDDLLGERNAEYYELLGKYNKLQAENEKIKATNESLNGALITKQATIDTLKADYDNDIKASYDLDDKHVEIIKRLETEKDALLVANGELLQSNLKLRSK